MQISAIFMNFLEKGSSDFHKNWGTTVFQRALSIGGVIFQHFLKEFKFPFQYSDHLNTLYIFKNNKKWSTNNLRSNNFAHIG